MFVCFYLYSNCLLLIYSFRLLYFLTLSLFSLCFFFFFFFKQKTAYELRISDWSSDVCSSDLNGVTGLELAHVRLIETRLLVRRTDGWVGLPYAWNADQTKATLQRAGADVPLTLLDGGKRTDFVYSVPNANQCAGCHTLDHRTRAVEPIGLQARHLNRTFPGAGGEIHQLERLVALGSLTGVPPVGIPRAADWTATARPPDARPPAYLATHAARSHSPHARPERRSAGKQGGRK